METLDIINMLQRLFKVTFSRCLQLVNSCLLKLNISAAANYELTYLNVLDTS
jgi:hypothetical protein